jgi:hypothetical protein
MQVIAASVLVSDVLGLFPLSFRHHNRKYATFQLLIVTVIYNNSNV